MRSLGSTTAITYACRVGTSICERANRASRSAIALEGWCEGDGDQEQVGREVVKTIVRGPIRPARRTAAWKESACRIPIAKKRTASVCGEASYLRVNR